MASIKYYLRPNPNKSKPHSVYIEFIKSRDERFREPIGVKIYKKHYDAKNQRVNTNHPNAETINIELDKYRGVMAEAVTKVDAGSMSLREAKSYVIKRFDATDLETYLETTDNWLEEEKGHYRNCIKYFKVVANISGKLKFDYINNDTFRKYTQNALKRVKDGLNASSTYKTYANGVMSVFNDAVAKGHAKSVIISKKNRTIKVIRTDSRANTQEEIKECIENVRTIEQWQSVALWLLMFGLRGLYPADLVRFNARRVRNIKGDKISPNWNGWHSEDVFIDYERSKTSVPMFLQFNKVTRILWERVKMTMILKHGHLKIDGKTYTSGLKDRCNFFTYSVTDNKKEHKKIWDNLNDKFSKSLNCPHINFKRARKSYFQIAEERYDKVFAKFLIGQETDKLTSYSYSNYKRPKLIKKTIKRHNKILKEFKYEELVYMALDKLLTLIKKPHNNYPYWIFYAQSIYKEGRNMFANIGGDNWQEIDSKYHKLFNDGALLLKNKDDYKVVPYKD